MDSSSSFCFNRLPKHLFELNILAKLSLKDLIRFGAISHSLRSLAAEIQNYYHQLPWLMISQDKDTQIGTFFSLSDARFYHLKLEHVPSQSYSCGSTQGYLIMANREENFLYNPFSHNQISLPQQFVPRLDMALSIPRDDFRYYFEKAILSSSSLLIDCSSQYVVGALGSNAHVIEMCRPHDAEWSVFSADEDVDQEYTIVSDFEDDEDELEEEEQEVVVASDDVVDDYKKLEEKTEEHGRKEKEIIVIQKTKDHKFSDILFYKGMLHGLTQMNELVIFYLQEDLRATYKVLNVLPMDRQIDPIAKYAKNYLVESCGELLMVYRYSNFYRDELTAKKVTTKFLVFKLEVSSDGLQWVEVKSIGDQVIFLGKTSSMSISAKGIPRFQSNCIYFTGDHQPYLFNRWDCSDDGIFYLDDGRIEPIVTPNTSISVDIQPLWVIPNKLRAV